MRCRKPPARQKCGLVFRLCQSYYPRAGKAHLQYSTCYTAVEEAEAAKDEFRRWVEHDMPRGGATTAAAKQDRHAAVAAAALERLSDDDDAVPSGICSSPAGTRPAKRIARVGANGASGASASVSGGGGGGDGGGGGGDRRNTRRALALNEIHPPAGPPTQSPALQPWRCPLGRCEGPIQARTRRAGGRRLHAPDSSLLRRER